MNINIIDIMHYVPYYLVGASRILKILKGRNRLIRIFVALIIKYF